MADPRTLAPDRRKDTRSDLMIAQAAATTGEKVNFCPFGCEDEEIDSNGYCDHLIGFTNDGKTFEPMVMDERTGRRIVRVPKELPLVQRGDKLVRISTSSRVYREINKAAKSA